MNPYILLLFFITYKLEIYKPTTSIQPYNEIHLSGFTDSTSIDIIIFPDSIIVYEIQLTYIDGYGDYKLGPRSRVYIIKDEMLWGKIEKSIKFILSKNIEPKRMEYSHTNTNFLKIICDDKVIWGFRYYDEPTEYPVFTTLTKIIYKTIIQGCKSPFIHNNKLFDLSNITAIDSIEITNVESKLICTTFDTFERINTLSTYSIIKDSNRIESIRNNILKLKIITSPELDIQKEKFQPKFQINFYKSKLRAFQMTSDSILISYNELQWLKVDSTFINALK